MAGSYNHIVTDYGNLRSNESFVDTIENLGDAYEMTEELFGMIWYLASEFGAPGAPSAIVKNVVEAARRNYKAGLDISKRIHRESPDNRRGD